MSFFLKATKGYLIEESDEQGKKACMCRVHRVNVAIVYDVYEINVLMTCMWFTYS